MIINNNKNSNLGAEALNYSTYGTINGQQITCIHASRPILLKNKIGTLSVSTTRLAQQNSHTCAQTQERGLNL